MERRRRITKNEVEDVMVNDTGKVGVSKKVE